MHIKLISSLFVIFLLSGCDNVKDAISSAEGACRVISTNSSSAVNKCEVMTRTSCASKDNSDTDSRWQYEGGGTKCSDF